MSLAVPQMVKHGVTTPINWWMDKVWHIHTMEYFSAIKRNKILIYAVSWMHLENSWVELRYKGPHSMWFHLHKISRIHKPIETGNRLWGLNRGEWGVTTNEYRVLLRGMSIIKLESSDGCPILWIIKKTKHNTELYALKGWISHYANYLSELVLKKKLLNNVYGMLLLTHLLTCPYIAGKIQC